LFYYKINLKFLKFNLHFLHYRRQEVEIAQKLFLPGAAKQDKMRSKKPALPPRSSPAWLGLVRSCDQQLPGQNMIKFTSPI